MFHLENQETTSPSQTSQGKEKQQQQNVDVIHRHDKTLSMERLQIKDYKKKHIFERLKKEKIKTKTKNELRLDGKKKKKQVDKKIKLAQNVSVS